MRVATLERPKIKLSQIGKMQWRGSDDGIQWTSWYPLLSVDQFVERYLYYQARIQIDGWWEMSKVERDEF